jgi:hypothetical protein
MSVFETFFISFDSDSEKLKKGADEAFKATDNLEKKLNETDHVADKLGSGFKGMAIAAAGVIASAVSIGAIMNSVFASVNIADRLRDQADLLGIDAEALSAWGDAAQMSGGSAEAFQATISSLTASLAQMDATGKSRVKPFFDELGINIIGGNGKAKDTLSLLGELADKFQGMDKQSIAGFGRKLGLDSGTILLLSQGRRGIEEIIARQKELGVITEKQTQISAKYNDQIDEMGHIVRTLGLSIAEIILPPLTKFLKMIADGFVYLREHENLLEAIGTTLKIVAAVITAYMLPALSSMAIAVLAATWPFIAIAAAIAGFILILEDVYAFMDGNPSLLGGWLKDFPKVELGLRVILELLKELLALPFNILSGFGGLIDKGMNFLVNGSQTISGADSNPLASQTSSSLGAGAISNKSSNISIGEIKIETQATDAEGISKGIGDGLRQQTKQTMSNFDDGIAG